MRAIVRTITIVGCEAEEVEKKRSRWVADEKQEGRFIIFVGRAKVSMFYEHGHKIELSLMFVVLRRNPRKLRW